MLPLNNCAHPDDAENIDESNLEIVWFEEGEGAAILCDNEMLCVFLGWSSPECP